MLPTVHLLHREPDQDAVIAPLKGQIYRLKAAIAAASIRPAAMYEAIANPNARLVRDMVNT